MQDPNEILQKFKTSKFLVASRSKGLICPLSMRLSSFDEAIGFGNISFWSTGIWFRSGIYLMEGDGFTNVHRQIRKIYRAGLLEVVDSKELDYRHQPYKILRVKESI
jgi:hypothetical protein